MVNLLDKLVEVFVPSVRILIIEIFPHGYNNVAGDIIFRHVIEVFEKFADTLWNIIHGTFLVIHYWFVIAQNIKAEPWRW